MGYLISTNILKHNFDVEKIRALNKAVGFYVYRIPGFKETFIDLDYNWHDKKPMDEPYSALNTLAEVIPKLHPDFCADYSFNRSIISMNLIFSLIFNSRVLTIDTDDDTRNLTVESNQGKLVKFRCLIADFEVVYSGDKVHIHPLDIDDVDPLHTDMSLFDHDDFVVHPRDREAYYNLHEIALYETRKFMNTTKNIIDLGEADSSDYEHTVLYQRRAHTGEEEINHQALKPKWKFW